MNFNNSRFFWWGQILTDDKKTKTALPLTKKCVNVFIYLLGFEVQRRSLDVLGNSQLNNVHVSMLGDLLMDIFKIKFCRPVQDSFCV